MIRRLPTVPTMSTTTTTTTMIRRCRHPASNSHVHNTLWWLFLMMIAWCTLLTTPPTMAFPFASWSSHGSTTVPTRPFETLGLSPPSHTPLAASLYPHPHPSPQCHRRRHRHYRHRCGCHGRRDFSIMASSNNHENDNHNNNNKDNIPNNNKNKNNNNHVSIWVEQYFPHITPMEAKNAWFTYQWEQGGGLLGIQIKILEPKEEDSQSQPPRQRRRRLLPWGMEETITFDTNSTNDNNDDERVVIHYNVTSLGWFFEKELVPYSHVSTVEFARDTTTHQNGKEEEQQQQDGTRMVWKVDFDTFQRAKLWQIVTLTNIETVSQNLASYVAPPLCYQRITHLIDMMEIDTHNTRENNNQTSSHNLVEEWLDFIWYQGGGLPLLPPLRLSNTTRMYLPLLLKEQIQHVVDQEDECQEIQYKVVNPNLIGLHTHSGSVRFVESSNNGRRIDMIWQVQVRPYKFWKGFVQWYLSAILSTLARNFKSHMRKPGATVPLSPPRGGGGSGSGNTTFMNVPLNTWVGGVLDAHLRDSRSTLEQTQALFQPWTWGRSSQTEEPGEGEIFWIEDPHNGSSINNK